MPRSRDRSRALALLAGFAALVALLLPAAGGAAWATNTAELDPGTCGQMLQIGSDRTASATDTPSFLLRGDGGLSSYAMSIDGSPIGTFLSNGFANVCITTSTPLADGPHVLTGTELAPHAGWTVTPLAFSVDTVRPAAPSGPVLAAYKDSGALGDGITKYPSVNLTGTAAPNESVQVSLSGLTVVGGARADASGHWSATTVTLLDGTYTLAAFALDSAGNRSVLSQTARLKIDSTPPPTPLAPTLGEATDEPGPVVTGYAPGDVATVRVYSDGVLAGTAVPGRTRTWRLALPALEPGSHTIAVKAVDAADNVTPLSPGLALTVAALPEPPAEPDPPAPPESDWRPALHNLPPPPAAVPRPRAPARSS